jgi:hypothetical protein
MFAYNSEENPKKEKERKVDSENQIFKEKEKERKVDSEYQIFKEQKNLNAQAKSKMFKQRLEKRSSVVDQTEVIKPSNLSSSQK